MAMKLKTTEIEGVTYAVIEDGKPVYDQDGKDIAFDAEHATRKIAELNSEAQRHRETKEALEAKIKAFTGIEDPEAARKALKTVANLDSKDLIEAGKVEEIKAAAIEATKQQMADAIKAKETEIESLKTEGAKLKKTLDDELIGGSFSRSKYVEDKIAVPSDLLQAQFGRHFKVEDGKLRAYKTDGNPIYSHVKPGEIAEFDEAIEILVSQYAHKDRILKGVQNNGSGAESSGGGGSNTLTRAAYDAMSFDQQRKAISDGKTIVDAR